MKKLNPLDKMEKALDIALEGKDENVDKAGKLIEGITREDLKELSRKQLGEYFFTCGKLCYFTDYPDEAIKTFTKSLKFVDEDTKAEIFYYIGASYNKEEKYKDALKYLKKGLNYKDISKKMKIEILSELIFSQENLDGYDIGIECANKIMGLYNNSPKLALDDYYYRSILKLAVFYWKLGNEQKMDEYSMMLLSMKNVPKWIRESMYCHLGHRYLAENKHKEAQQYYKKALSYAEEKEDKDYYKDLIDECNKGLNYKVQ